MYIVSPRLLYIEATAKEYAAGLDEHGEPVYRIQTESPLKAAGIPDKAAHSVLKD